jgi:hypothetical protein
MIDRAALLERLSSCPDRVECAGHPGADAAAICGACGAAVCAGCRRDSPSGARCAACPEAPSPAGLRAVRWCLTPMGGAVAAILLLSGAAALVPRTPDSARSFTRSLKETPEWRAAMAHLARASRLHRTGDVFGSHGDEARAARYRARAAEEYEAFIRDYPTGERVATRAFAEPRARLAIGRCRGGREEREICERILREHAGESVAILAALRWAERAEDPRAAEVGGRLEAVLERISMAGDAAERIADKFAHSAAEEFKRRAIEDFSGTKLPMGDARQEALCRLGEWHAATGAREKALERLHSVDLTGPWGERAARAIREIESRSPTPPATGDDLKVEKLGK